MTGTYIDFSHLEPITLGTYYDHYFNLNRIFVIWQKTKDISPLRNRYGCCLVLPASISSMMQRAG